MRTWVEELERAVAFWNARVVRRSGCWGWNANKHQGYGTQRVGNTSMRATWIAWLAVHGELPAKGMQVLHRCDNPECTNPDHLFLGTQRDNMRDRAAKNRDKLANGMHFNSKRTPDQVRYIRASYPKRSLKELGEELGIAPATVWAIATRKFHKSII